MSKWFLENQLGLNPPFLLKNIMHRNKNSKSLKGILRSKIPEEECAKLTVLKIEAACEKIEFSGFIKNGREIIPVEFYKDIHSNEGIQSDKNIRTITTFSCFDQIHLFLYTFQHKRLRMFYTAFYCCQKWNTEEINMEEIGLFGTHSFVERGTNKITIKVKIENLRENGYHYNINGFINECKETFKLDIFDNKYNVEKFQCAFCLKKYLTIEELGNHINHAHLYYKCFMKKGILTIKKVTEEIEYQKEFLYINNGVRRSVLSEEELVGDHVNNYRIISSKYFTLKVKKYPFDRRLQIEKEYDEINTSDVLAMHLNKRIKNVEKTKEITDDKTVVIKSVKEEIMKEWNRMRIKEQNIKKILKNIIEMFGIRKETCKLLEILYKQGVLNSIEIIQVLNSISQDINE
ncbi:hypothetical protein NUSPORA_01373 [Nucleospora cyclopteri]